MTFKKNALEYSIRTYTDIAKLTFLKEFGLDMILADDSIHESDFNASDKQYFVDLINLRLYDLGGQ